MDGMTRLVAIAVVLALTGSPLVALDRARDAREAMPCCQGDSCPQESGQAPDCCQASPGSPAGEGPALKVERKGPSSLPVLAVLPSPPSSSPDRIGAAVAPPLDTSPSRPTVLRL